MPAAGKTTVAAALARRHGLRRYHADAHTWEHRDRALAAGDRHARRFEDLGPVERWRAPVADLLRMSLHEQRGPMTSDDVRALPPAPLTIAEGTPVTPRITGGDPAVWLLVSPETQRARLADRRLGPERTSLYLALGERIAHDTAGSLVLYTDRLSPADTVAAVDELFAGVLAAAPKAETDAQRSELLRYANRAQLSQVRGFFARPWADGDPQAVVKPLDCECGSPDCSQRLEIAIGDYVSPLLAAGHHPPG